MSIELNPWFLFFKPVFEDRTGGEATSTNWAELKCCLLIHPCNVPNCCSRHSDLTGLAEGGQRSAYGIGRWFVRSAVVQHVPRWMMAGGAFLPSPRGGWVEVIFSLRASFFVNLFLSGRIIIRGGNRGVRVSDF